MGYGDEIIGSGFAKGAVFRKKKIAFGDSRIRKIIWSSWAPDIYRGNPNVASPGEEHLENLEWIEHYKGKRMYNSISPDRKKWIWHYEFKPIPGELFFNEEERQTADEYGRNFIVIEPNVPWQKEVAPNKDWGEGKYEEVALQLMREGYRIIQFKHNNSRRIINGAEVVAHSRFRQVLAILSRAALYVGPEGGMHHGAAAVGVRAVVLFGGFIPPKVTGYDAHVNLTGGAEACGNIKLCDHCRKAMKNISIDEVFQSAKDEMNEIRNCDIAKRQGDVALHSAS